MMERPCSINGPSLINWIGGGQQESNSCLNTFHNGVCKIIYNDDMYPKGCWGGT